MNTDETKQSKLTTNPEQRLHDMRIASKQGGGEKRIQRQHDKGKLTARERLDLLLDPGSFHEIDAFVTHRSSAFGLENQKVLGDGVVTGSGTINGRPVYVQSRFYRIWGVTIGNPCRKNM